MEKVEEIRSWIESVPKPICDALTPFEVMDVDVERGWIRFGRL